MYVFLPTVISVPSFIKKELTEASVLGTFLIAAIK